MADHVDILKTGAVQPLARVLLEDGHVEVLADDVRFWREFLTSVSGIDPDEHPAEFFAALPERLDGSHIYATPPHQEGDDCPAPGAEWPMHAVA